MPALHDNVMQVIEEMGGERALRKAESLKVELLKLHNRADSAVREDEKGCWDGCLAAWKRAGMPEKGERGYDSTPEGILLMSVILEQYNRSELQEVFGRARDEGREKLNELDYLELEQLTFHTYDIVRDELIGIEAGLREAAACI